MSRPSTTLAGRAAMLWNAARLTVVVLGIALLGPPGVEAEEEGEMRTWTSSVGTETEASLLGVRVLLKCRDGREIAVAIEQLGEADQEYVRQWIARRRADAAQAARAAKSSASEAKTEPSPAGAEDASAAMTKTGSGGARVVEVLVTGVGTTPEQAEHDAFTRAVQETVGVLVESETVVSNEAIIKDKVLTFSQGYVQGFEVLRVYEKDGLHHADIRAKVKVSELHDRLKAADLAVLPVDGRMIWNQAQLNLRNRQNAAEMLASALRDFGPETLIRLRIAGEPQLVDQNEQFATLRVLVESTPHLENWKKCRNDILRLLSTSELTMRTHLLAPCEDSEYESTRFYQLKFNSQATDRMWALQGSGEVWGYWIHLAQSFMEGTEPHVMRSRWDAYALDKSVGPIFEELNKREYRARVMLMSNTNQVLGETERKLSLWKGPMRCLWVSRDKSWKKDSFFLGPFLWGGGYYYSPAFPMEEFRVNVALNDLRNLDRAVAKIECVEEVE